MKDRWVLRSVVFVLSFLVTTSYFHRGTITTTFRRSRNDVVIRTDSHRSHH